MVAFAALLTSLFTAQDVGRLIQDLGAADYAVREKASEELRKIGPAAAPALRKALEDKDAERAYRAGQILEEIEKQQKKPALVTPGVLPQDDFEKWWQDFRKQLDPGPFAGPERDFDKWMDEQLKLLEGLRGMRPRRVPAAGGVFGLRVEPVSEALAAQLDLKEGEGVQIAEVVPGSAAEKAGLKLHDILLTVNGSKIADRWKFRQQIREASGKAFDLEIVRSGKRETVHVKPEK